MFRSLVFFDEIHQINDLNTYLIHTHFICNCRLAASLRHSLSQAVFFMYSDLLVYFFCRLKTVSIVINRGFSNNELLEK